MTTLKQEDEFECARVAYHHILRYCFDSTPEWHGKMFRPKAGDANPHKGKVPMSFSLTLIDFAGGMYQLREWWEVDTRL